MSALLARAYADLRSAIENRSVWWALACEDVTDSHRRTLLGPVWPLLNYLLFCGALLLVIGSRTTQENFTVFLATGLVVWLFINDVLTTGATLFVREASFIKGTVLPISSYVFRQTSFNAIRALYALVGAVPLIIYAGVSPGMALLTVPLALLLVLMTAPAITMIFALIGALFRDFQYIVSNSMRLLFFVTPVFWKHDNTGGLLGFVYHWNPLTHYIDIVRRPVVEGIVPVTSWLIAGAVTVFLSTVALVLLGKFRSRIVFVV